MAGETHGTRSNDGRFGGKLLQAEESWVATTDGEAGDHINAIVPTSSTAVILGTLVGNIDSLSSKTIEKPILGRWTTVALAAGSGDAIVYFG